MVKTVRIIVQFRSPKTGRWKTYIIYEGLEVKGLEAFINRFGAFMNDELKRDDRVGAYTKW